MVLPAASFVPLLCRPLRRFRRETRGGVLIETAAILPILVFMLLGGFEVGRYFLMGQKLQRAAMTVSDLASRAETLTGSDIDDLFAAAQEVGSPFTFIDEGRVIVSSVTRAGSGDPPTISWQRSAGAGLSSSVFGAEGETVSGLDPDLIKPGGSIIVAEVRVPYEPVLFSDFPVQPLYASAMFRPRFSKVVTLE